MNCPVHDAEKTEILLDYCAQRLSAEAMAELERHIRNCPGCRAFASAQQDLWQSLDAWEPQPVSEDFDRKLYARIEEFESRSFWRRWIAPRLSWRPALSIGAACAALVVALVVQSPVSHAPMKSKIQENRKAEAIVEPEQVERALEDLEMLKQLSPSNMQSL